MSKSYICKPGKVRVVDMSPYRALRHDCYCEFLLCPEDKIDISEEHGQQLVRIVKHVDVHCNLSGPDLEKALYWEARKDIENGDITASKEIPNISWLKAKACRSSQG